MWRNNVVPDRPQKTIRLVWWVTKATDTQSEYVILIAFPLQQWLRQRTSMLHLSVNWLCCLNTQSVLQVHRKYRKCFSLLHTAAGISKISLVQYNTRTLRGGRDFVIVRSTMTYFSERLEVIKTWNVWNGRFGEVPESQSFVPHPLNTFLQ